MAFGYVIHKYEVLGSDFVLNLPENARILDVQVQFTTPMLWAVVDPDAPKIARRFRLIPTGMPFDGSGVYLGTFQVDGGRLVFHLWEK